MFSKCNILWLFVIMWMLFIFSLSSDPGNVSAERSRMVVEILEPIIEKIEGAFEIELMDKSELHFYVRKGAHVFSYFVLSLLLVLSFKASGFTGVKPYYLGWFIATGFSALDEFYQTFVPGRSGEVWDVLVDNIGVNTGLLVVWIYEIVKNRIMKSWSGLQENMFVLWRL